MRPGRSRADTSAPNTPPRSKPTAPLSSARHAERVEGRRVPWEILLIVEGVGIFDLFRRPAQIVASVAAPGSSMLESPHATSQAQQLVWQDYYRGEFDEVTRNSAMQVPAIARGRGVLVGVIGQMPFVQLDAADTDTTPAWLHTTNGGVSPWHRLAWTLDDLIFTGWSLWAVERDKSKQITDAARIPRDMWSQDASGYIRVGGKTVPAAEVILIPGPFEGLLTAGAGTIRGARALERAWIGRAQNPIPLIELHQLTDDSLTTGDEDAGETTDEVGDLLAAWAAARTSPNGAVGFTDNRVEVRTHGAINTDLFEQGRNAIVLDVGRLLGIPASLLDGSMSTASLTYSTGESKRNEFLDFALSYWTAPIEARLSMDDVCPSGHRIRFDRSSMIAVPNPPTALPMKD